MSLTLEEIKEKQLKLKEDLEKLLNDFQDETTIKVVGEIDVNNAEHNFRQYVHLSFRNPFH